MVTQQKALFLQAKHGDWAVGTTEKPKPGPGEILVRIEAAALNPVDWKVQGDYSSLIPTYPAILGTDTAGVVEELGEGVSNFSVGDRVLYQGGFKNRNASFQQFNVVSAEIVAKIPSNVTFDQAATVPVTLAAAFVGLYHTQGDRGGAGLAVPWDGGEGKYADQPILILGGSSSVGQFVIQLAKLSGFSPIITTTSSKNAEYVKSLGATHIIDRNKPLSELSANVKQITQKPINIVYDAISESDTQNAAYDILAPGGWLVILLVPTIEESKRTADKHIAGPVANFQYPQYRETGVILYKQLTKLLETGKLKPNNVEVIGGLANIPEGLQRLKSGQVSANKLVAHPQE